MAALPKRTADEDDVAQNVFVSLFRGVEAGRFPRLADRSDLWQILLMLTHQKVVELIRHETRDKRGGGSVRGESVFTKHDNAEKGFDLVSGAEPGPEFEAVLKEEYDRLLALLSSQVLRQVALFRFEGYSNQEIAERLGMTTRSVERKLQQIRKEWAKELVDQQ
jgi:RNA polymerase sigma factor (sigma-70 family)